MYNQPIFANSNYMNDLQQMRDRIDRQMMNFNQVPQQQPQITQNFQLQAQNQNDLDGKYAKDVDEVKGSLIFKNTLFIDKDNSMLWIKDVSGNIKTYSLQEIIELDEKDKQILELKKEIEELKGSVVNAKSDNVDVVKSTTSKKS